LADKLLSFISLENACTIADFCVGNGALLKSAQRFKPSASFYGSDISNQAISQLKKQHPDWHLSKCDFINQKSRNSANILKQNSNGFDLVLLNPPFSCKGGTNYTVNFEDKDYNVSTSMFFVVESLKYLSSDGVLLAILPNSVAYSQKDRLIWKKLVSDYKLNILEQPLINLFENCSPNVILVSINTNQTKSIYNYPVGLSHDFKDISLFRGKISMNTLNGSYREGDLLIHSTNLRTNRLVNLGYKTKNDLSKIVGPAVLVPRVGLPNPQKICMIKNKESYVLSDCVIGIKTNTNKDAKKLMELILSNWDRFKELYKGTGAKYTTLERLGLFLSINEPQYTIHSLSGTLAKHTTQSLKPNFAKEPSTHLRKVCRQKNT
ncbi:MAG: methyltransferase, partial [bacterium]